MDWLNSLFSGSGKGFDGLLTIVIFAVAVALLLAAFFIFGLPRLNRRSKAAGELFGSGDSRDAAALRRAADAAARGGDWVLAIEEMFRALAKSLAERTVLTVSPGTTAHDFAVRAATAFPAERAGLTQAARSFDDVRYLGRPGTAEGYTELVELDRAIRANRPAFLDAVDDVVVPR